MMKHILVGFFIATMYYLHAPFYLRLRSKFPKTAVAMARGEKIVEFIFLALVLGLLVRSL